MSAAGVVIGVALGMPGSLESGFSNYANYSNIQLVSEKLSEIDTKLDALTAKSG